MAIVVGCSGDDPGQSEMRSVESGTFWMGCDESRDQMCFPYELPYHQIQLDAFEVERTEVTQAQYAACLEAGECSRPNCEWDPGGKSSSPVVCVSWLQASDYCAYAGKRLCSEAEWERAARGTDGRIYPWGDQAPSCSLAVMDQDGPGCGSGGPLPVDSRPEGKSPAGAQDMSGNVLEWVADWYSASYYQQSPESNPPGPPEGVTRVIRGGSFNASALTMRASYRASANPEFGYYDLGLRCCR